MGIQKILVFSCSMIYLCKRLEGLQFPSRGPHKTHHLKTWR